MLNWLKKWRTTEEEQREERITAYVDDALTAVEKRAFEQEMGADDTLRQAVEAEVALKTTLSQLPRLRAPRNFTLDTAVYANRPRSTFALDWYPRLRTATAVVGFLLVGIIALNFLTPPTPFDQALAPMAQEVAVMDNMMEEEVSESETLRVMPEAAEPEDMAADSALYAVEEAEEMAEATAEESAGESDATMTDEAASAAPPAEISPDATAITSLENVENAESEPSGESGAAADSMPALAPTMIMTEATVTPLPTAVVLSPPEIEPEPEPTNIPSFSLWQISQLSLLILFFILLTATLITRRRL